MKGGLKMVQRTRVKYKSEERHHCRLHQSKKQEQAHRTAQFGEKFEYWKETIFLGLIMVEKLNNNTQLEQVIDSARIS